MYVYVCVCVCVYFPWVTLVCNYEISLISKIMLINF